MYFPIRLADLNHYELIHLPKKTFSFLFFYCLAQSLFAQIMPVNNSKLNHLVAGFAIPPEKEIAGYELQIAAGTHMSEKLFEQNIFLSKKGSESRFIAELPEFGKHYTWRVQYLNKAGKRKGQTELYHFATGLSVHVDTSRHRLRVVDNNMTDTNLLLLTDSKAVIYNLKGKPIWYWKDAGDISLRDFKPTKDGTFTLLGDVGYEIDYYGNVLWKAPNDGRVSGDTTERYHHELTKLDNGHYMICGQEFIYQQLPAGMQMDTTGFTESNMLVKKDGKVYKKNFSGNLIEYDKDGNIVWQWKSASVFPDSIFFSKSKRAVRAFLGTGTHMNSFYFDQVNNAIYVSFRNINTVVKISYPSGKLITSYGQYKDGHFGVPADTPFIHQHNCSINDRQELFLFNNNNYMNNYGVSKLEIYKENTKENTLQKIWEYSCKIDTNALPNVLSGGSIYELPDKNILGGMGVSGRIFIVNRDKKLLWNAIPESINDVGQRSNTAQYRASYMYFNNLERYIFK